MVSVYLRKIGGKYEASKLSAIVVTCAKRPSMFQTNATKKVVTLQQVFRSSCLRVPKKMVPILLNKLQQRDMQTPSKWTKKKKQTQDFGLFGWVGINSGREGLATSGARKITKMKCASSFEGQAVRHIKMYYIHKIYRIRL
ncbi:hypothetical protein BC938DRAFT_484010 [Jimgerdemannia flammicorona]|uniref:Uncharacterized protein n=1 Tax=Jimgerdemannia flammicorona TaxID=994334 RepID=A0A433QAN5_9FUNG|nr:hypothetical protein BC938DRAFT_484010 [Jimgerdemannia flammicorona]